ncbi:restriction endonuclease subunit S [Mycoplasmopsis cynos]|uniref:restriction endonuclease subunit S n=2 Tax=Mycoplasmopsis cynos TaxID=171284 RepID=UPI002202CA6F|nr:restriction endonuclease subunit S [Mycoplasmopsis cynos]UWV93861.1 restriction endonuclease subunit S [Mycoplasmopsis cynos]WQQ18398.1 restriction endonuclease subunit S [Mycoplasmopsis cynos]
MSKNNMVPSIRFKEFTNAWEQEKIGNIFTITRGYVLGKEKISLEKNAYFKYPVFSSQTGNNGLMGYYNSYLFDKAITWTTDGIYAGDVNYRDEKFYCTNVCGVLLNNDGYINLCNAISINKVSKKHVTKVGNPKLMNNVMKEILFSYSNNLKEQTNISIIFNNINSLITLHQRKLNALENLKKTLLEKMFPSENSVFPSIRFKEFTNAWEQERLGEIVDYFNGSSNEKEQTNEGKFEIVNLNSISISGELKPSGKFLHNAFETLKKGDIVMILSDIALGNLLGKSAVIPVDNRYVLNQRVALLRKNNSKFNSKFISLFLNKNQSLLFRKGAGSSQLNLSKKEVINFLIFSTSRNEQDKVSLIFNNINSLITLHQRKLNALENLKKTLLEKMFV